MSSSERGRGSVTCKTQSVADSCDFVIRHPFTSSLYNANNTLRFLKLYNEFLQLSLAIDGSAAPTWQSASQGSLRALHGIFHHVAAVIHDAKPSTGWHCG